LCSIACLVALSGIGILKPDQQGVNNTCEYCKRLIVSDYSVAHCGIQHFFLLVHSWKQCRNNSIPHKAARSVKSKEPTHNFYSSMLTFHSQYCLDSFGRFPFLHRTNVRSSEQSAMPVE